MQINFLTYLRKSYTLGRWLGMVVHVTLGIIGEGPTLKALARLHTNKRKKAWVQAWKLEPISLTDWNFFELISHYATRGLEIASYLVSLDRYPNYLHPCSSVYTHSQQ